MVRLALVLLLAWVTIVAVADVGVAATTLTPDVPSGQPVGTTVTWTINSTLTGPLDFRLSAAEPGGPLRVVYDFNARNVMKWTTLEDGIHKVVATVRDRGTGQSESATVFYRINSRAIFGPMVSPTANPLVALYSGPPCGAGNFMRVVFNPLLTVQAAATSPKPCKLFSSVNFYVAGMRPTLTYALRHEVLDSSGNSISTGPVRYFTAGTPSVSFPNKTVVVADSQASRADGIVLHSPILPSASMPVTFPFATDLLGRPLWYHAPPPAEGALLVRALAGGTFLLTVGDTLTGIKTRILREVDLAGNTVREVHADRITEQLAAVNQDAFGSFHHDAIQLPDGRVAVIGSVERILTDVQGPGPVNVVGDYIVVLDEDWQVVWVWNSFDHMDASRAALLGEVCVSSGPGCPPLFLGPTANDWLHANALTYSASDGNLLMSLRHQDWVIKVDYRNGAGTGQVVWRLGPDGDFTSLNANDPFPFFSHQHNPEYTPDGRLLVYDNGNTRCAGVPGCVSRGQLYALDEVAMTATLDLNVNLEGFAFAVGSAQVVGNGNFSFGSGALGTQPVLFSEAEEFSEDGTRRYALRTQVGSYRSVRMPDLYSPYH